MASKVTVSTIDLYWVFKELTQLLKNTPLSKVVTAQVIEGKLYFKSNTTTSYIAKIETEDSIGEETVNFIFTDLSTLVACEGTAEILLDAYTISITTSLGSVSITNEEYTQPEYSVRFSGEGDLINVEDAKQVFNGCKAAGSLIKSAMTDPVYVFNAGIVSCRSALIFAKYTLPTDIKCVMKQGQIEALIQMCESIPDKGFLKYKLSDDEMYCKFENRNTTLILPVGVINDVQLQLDSGGELYPITELNSAALAPKIQEITRAFGKVDITLHIGPAPSAIVTSGNMNGVLKLPGVLPTEGSDNITIKSDILTNLLRLANKEQIFMYRRKSNYRIFTFGKWTVYVSTI